MSRSKVLIKPSERLAFNVVLIVLGIAVGATWASLNHVSMGYLPPCEFEDSVNCYWDASERGNGQGNDFISVEEE